ncbi:MAG: radical SAM protein, partial [Hydrotalea flava]|nr:radical SAM protein [Hydrotalea flava]
MEVTIEITDYCPHNCDYCSTDAGTPGRHLDFEEIRKFLNQVQVEHGTIKRINISGGE